MENMSRYIVNVHGLKGSSAGIGVETVRQEALNLETKARAGDLQGVLEHKDKLIADTEAIIANINAWLEKHDAKSDKKPLLKAPDKELLSRLRLSCEKYDINEIDKIMSELENADYEEGAELMEWLRKKINVSKMREVVQRLKEEEGGRTNA